MIQIPSKKLWIRFRIKNKIKMSDYDQLFQSVLVEVDNAMDSELLEKTRIKFLGKNGLISLELKKISSLSPEEKKTLGKELNEFKNILLKKINIKKKNLDNEEIEKKLLTEFSDPSMPCRDQSIITSKIHPITQTIEEIVSILGSMGLSYAEGPDIEDDFHNFTALNIPENHPARQMHDTFYIKSDEKKDENNVLRTHTSPVQIRTLLKKPPPIRIFAPGRTYRCDSDVTHTPMFHQVEGLIVEEKINFANLKWFLTKFCKIFFENDNLKLRFRPSFFPFTEPSAEVDINCSFKNGKINLGEGEKWMEILGCGMVHPNVYKFCDLDSKLLSGFAFGMGIERLAMLKYGMPDLRSFFENDLNWLKHYGFSFLDQPDLNWE